ncbi:hypothetical protein GW17_00007634 [Ensete ventricosum]|nr:hypothetical protein GW17_00007634 [Ensete ventricosum]
MHTSRYRYHNSTVLVPIICRYTSRTAVAAHWSPASRRRPCLIFLPTQERVRGDVAETGKAPYRAVHIGHPAYRYVDRSLPSGTT